MQYLNTTATGVVKATAGTLYGVVVNSHTSGTVVFNDGAGATSAGVKATGVLTSSGVFQDTETVTVEGKTYEVEVEILDEGSAAPAPRRGSSGGSRVAAPIAAPKPQAAAPVASGSAGAVGSPLAAVVVSVDVNVGDTIEEGQKLITLEAMKMNTIVAAPAAGTVKAILTKAGDGVEEGQALIEVA